MRQTNNKKVFIMTANNTVKHIERLQQQLASELLLIEHINNDPLLKGLYDRFNPVLHVNQLYGVDGALSFKVTKDLLQDIIPLFDSVVTSCQASGTWFYSQFPQTFDIKNKDNKVSNIRTNHLMAEYGVNNLSVSFYYETEQKKLIKIKLDFLNVIIGQNYNQFSRDLKIPCLVENPRYNTKTKSSETKYVGKYVNVMTDNFAVYALQSVGWWFDLVEQFGVVADE